MKTILRFAAVLAISAFTFGNWAIAEEVEVPLDKLPKAVVDAVKKMFPKATMIKATQEEDDGEIEYEVTVKDNGKLIEITVEADGEIEELEREIDLKDLPKAVTAALEKEYPQSVHKSAEAAFKLKKGKEVLQFYEVQLKTADNREIEVKIKADGKIVEESDDD